MSINLKELSRRESALSPGHRLCAGCGEPTIVRQILQAAEKPVVVANATGCLEVTSAIYPTSAWRVPWIHSAFENVAATISGVEAAYKAFKRWGEMDDDIRFVAFAGDGGTYDIGLQSLSGALERGHRFVYVCLDNGAYMNTGIQRSSATPFAAWTTTSPVGEKVKGKTRPRKNLTEIAVAHGIPYVAQGSPAHWRDLMTKARKAFNADGPAFLNVVSPCVPGWGYESPDTINMARLAVDTCYWPLYEVENGQYRITVRPKQKRPIEDWLRPQARFRHLLAPANRPLLDQLQAEIDRQWEQILRRAGESASS